MASTHATLGSARMLEGVNDLQFPPGFIALPDRFILPGQLDVSIPFERKLRRRVPGSLAEDLDVPVKLPHECSP